MRADRAAPTAGSFPGSQDLSQLAHDVLGVGHLSLEQRPHLNAGTGARAPQPHDAANLAQGESDTARLLDERDDPQDVRRVAAMAGGGPARWRQDAPRLV
jgi:hypothetical protein